MDYYYSFSSYCKKTFKKKLYRVALDAGMTCPNRDGCIDTRGCIFCDEGGSGDFAVAYNGQKLSLEDLKFNHQQAPSGDYIAYFQAYTNTYAPIDRLEMLFSHALEDDLFSGISIATRADCIHEDTIGLLKRLKEKYPHKFIWIELGLQTVKESSAIFIRRGYPLEVFDRCVKELHKINIPVISHVIIGLPNESKEDILNTIKHINALKIEGVKLQLLHYLKDTDLGRMYEENSNAFHILSLEEYTDIIVDCVGHLDKNIVIHRLTGDGAGELLLAPLWSKDKRKVLNLIMHKMKVNHVQQGCLICDDANIHVK